MAVQPLIQQFQDDINAVIDKYREQGMTLGETIGVLEIVKINVWMEHRETSENNN